MLKHFPDLPMALLISGKDHALRQELCMNYCSSFVPQHTPKYKSISRIQDTPPVEPLRRTIETCRAAAVNGYGRRSRRISCHASSDTRLCTSRHESEERNSKLMQDGATQHPFAISLAEHEARHAATEIQLVVHQIGGNSFPAQNCRRQRLLLLSVVDPTRRDSLADSRGGNENDRRLRMGLPIPLCFRWTAAATVVTALIAPTFFTNYLHAIIPRVPPIAGATYGHNRSTCHTHRFSAAI